MEKSQPKTLFDACVFLLEKLFRYYVDKLNSKSNTINTESGIRNLFLKIGQQLSRFAVCDQQRTSSYFIWYKLVLSKLQTVVPSEI